MDAWLLFGILAYTCYGISTSLDKYVVRVKYMPLVVNAVKMLLDGLILILLAILFVPFALPALGSLWPLLLLGLLYGAAGVFYFTALEESEATEIIPYSLGVKILLLFLFSLLLFREVATLLDVVGVLVILIGVFLILARKMGRLTWSRGLLFITLSILLGVGDSLLAKHLVASIDPIVMAILMYLVSALLLFGYLAARRRLWHAAEVTFDLLALTKVGVSALFGAVGTLLVFTALKLGEASEVLPLIAIEAVILLLAGRFFLREHLTPKRVVGIVAVALGIFLLAG